MELIFLKSFLFCKHACKRLFIRLLSVFGYSLIRYSYQTYKIYMCGRFDRPFFGWLAPDHWRQCTRSLKAMHQLSAWPDIYWSGAMFIAYIRTCVRVLLIQLWPCYETTLSTMHVETSFNTITNIWMSYDWSRERCGVVVVAWFKFWTLKAPWAWIRSA